MSEINLDPMKEAIQDYEDGRCANFSNKQFIKWLSSLITTIESQKEEIEILNNFQKGYKVVEADLNSQIESLKVIKELAVKGLKWYSDPNNEEPGECGTYAKNTLSEIERLQNV